jgi:hypothetical protein
VEGVVAAGCMDDFTCACWLLCSFPGSELGWVCAMSVCLSRCEWLMLPCWVEPEIQVCSPFPRYIWRVIR